jgi:hypothetical protein
VTKNLQQDIERQRGLLQQWLHAPLTRIAEDCGVLLHEREALDRRLTAGLLEIPYCKYLYVLDDQLQQVSSNASRQGLLGNHRGRNRAQRPYLAGCRAGQLFSLSHAYISRNSRRPSLTAAQAILGQQGAILGFLAADFDLRELPVTQASYRQPGHWMQLKGDPAIRSGLFNQERAISPLDEQVDTVLAVLEELITVNGVFHTKLHFSSSRATIWAIDDPFNFRIHGIDDLVNPDLCLVYPHRPYPENATIPTNDIKKIFQYFRKLRYMDETIYLRSGMLNIFNGLVGLTFSCDGSHYMPWDEFLEKDMEFWVGKASNGGPSLAACANASPQSREVVGL